MSATPAADLSKAMAISSARLLEGLEPAVKTSFLGEANKVEVPANVQLCAEGQKASHLFLLTKGHAKYYRLTNQGKQVILYWLAPGDTFGLGTLLPDPPPYMGSADSVSACEVVSWEHATIRRFALTHPQLACNALAIVLNYLSLLTDRHTAILGNAANDRIARTLLNLGKRKGNLNPSGVDLDITNEELASLADVSPFTVSRVLNEWRRKGAVTKRRKTLRIHAPEALLPRSS